MTKLPPVCPRMMAFDHTGELAAIYCKSWKCPVCRKRNAAHWAMRVRYGMEYLGVPALFWTLTMPGKVKTAEYGYEILPKMWESVRKAMQRASHPHVWHYCAFVEGQPQRDDMPHFHIITFQRWPRKFKRFKDFAVSHGFGYQAYSERVNSVQGAVYVAKYASKALYKSPAHFRRVRMNEEWPQNLDFQPYIVKSSLETTAEFIIRASWETEKSMQELFDLWEEGWQLLPKLREQNRLERAIDDVRAILYDFGD